MCRAWLWRETSRITSGCCGRLLKRSAPVTHIAQSNGEFASLLATAGLDEYVYFVDVRVGEEACGDN